MYLAGVKVGLYVIRDEVLLEALDKLTATALALRVLVAMANVIVFLGLR
jgi:hypothetical protein